MVSPLELAFTIFAVIFTLVGSFFLCKKLNNISAKNIELQKTLLAGLRKSYIEQCEMSEFTMEYCGAVFDISNNKDLDIILDEMEKVTDDIIEKLLSIYQVCQKERIKPDISKKRKKRRFW